MTLGRMEFVTVTRFSEMKERNTLLKCVEQFNDNVRKLVSGHSRGQDMSADIMKKICKRPKIQDAPVLSGLLDTFKEFVFQYHQNTTSSNNNNSNNMFGSPDEEISEYFYSKQETIFSIAKEREIIWETKKIMYDVEDHQAIIREAVKTGQTTQLQSRYAEVYSDVYAHLNGGYTSALSGQSCDDIPETKKWLDVMGDKYCESSSMYQHGFALYEDLKQSHRDILTTIQARGRYVQTLIEEEIQRYLQLGVDQLLEVSKSLNLTENLRIRLADVNNIVCAIAHEIYQQMCSTYSFPDITEGKGMITEGAGELRETHLNTDRARGTDGSGTRLASNEEIDLNSEDVYVKVVQLHTKVSAPDLKLKTGQKIKQKAVSKNGEAGFGWTRSIFGRKKWGFFDTKLTKFHHSSKRSTQAIASR